MRSRDLCCNESNVKFEVGWASVGWGVHYTANMFLNMETLKPFGF